MGVRETKGLPVRPRRAQARVGNSCSHEKTEARKRPAVWGGVVQEQCVKCGRKLGTAIRLDIFSPEAQRLIPLWEPSKRPNSKRRAYLEYLKTHAWRRLRQRRLEQDGYTCTVQLEGCTVEAEQVHHKTYERLGREWLSDLQSCCESCHRSIEGKAG